jgi:hypothetical protein
VASGTSYNGWPASDSASAIGVDYNALGGGVKFPGGIKAGDVATVLGYVADQLNARVEPVTANPDGTGYGCWGWTYKANVNNPSQLSCHASSTAIDWIAPSHPNGSGGTFTDSQVATIYAILAEVQGGVDWLEGYDEMHFEIAVNAATLADIAASLPGTQPSPPDESWFDMASKDELAAVVWEQINRPEYLDAIATTVWSKMVSDRAANDLLNAAGKNAEWAAQGITAIPVNVWTTPITGDGDDQRANALLAKAAAG